MPVTTRTTNSEAHPGNPVTAGQRKRRTKAEMQAAKETEGLAQATKLNEELTRQAVIERLAVLESQAANAAKAKLAATAMPPTPSSLVVKGAGSSRGKGTNVGITGNMKAKGSKSKKSGVQEDSHGSVNKEPKSVDKLTQRNIEIVRAALETPTRKGRSGKKTDLLIVGNKKAKTTAGASQASGFRDGYAGASSNNSGKGPAKAKAGTVQAKDKAALESDPIEEGDDDDDIEMLEEYSEEGDSEGEKEERGAVEVIDVDATSSEDGESIPPFGDEAE
ncbi:hypothetical protein PHLCEN_2v11646, partial [Hermanssonia centrifuga]